MTPKVFFSKETPPRESPHLLSLLHEALSLLFPTAVFFDWPETTPRSPPSLFLRDGENILWAEFVFAPFSRNEISDYLQKARQIQSTAPSGISGILFAPDFEAGVQELLEFIRIPVRLFRYQEGIPLGPLGRSFQETVLWFQEVTASASDKIILPVSSAEENFLPEIPAEALPPSSSRLSREELREFIQLELDVAVQESSDRHK